MHRTYPYLLLALGALLVWLTLRDTSGIREFRGTLRTGLRQIGGETTGVIIVTSEGTYELDLKQKPEWSNQLPQLDGKQVTVEGKLVVPGRRRRAPGRQWRRLEAPERATSRTTTDEPPGRWSRETRVSEPVGR